MEIGVNVATNIVQRLVDRTIDETRYLCCFSNIAEDYENEKNELMTKQRIVEDKAQEARNKNEQIAFDVKDWPEKAANLIGEDTKIKKSCFFGLLPNCIWFYRRGKDLEGKTQEIKKLVESFKFDTRPIEPPGVEYYSLEDFIRFESRNYAQEQLHEALQNDDNFMVGLHGIGGSGKTKLVKQVGNEVQKSKLFDKVIFVVVSNPPDVRKIQDEIASQLDLSLNGNESERPKKLWLRLRNGQKILIILDDVWEKLYFEHIGIPPRNNHEGCRVLLTTREMEVCRLMECQNTIDLKLLPETEAWILFQRFANIRDDSNPALKDVAQKITSECKGLPVAITTMASTLKEQPLEDWRGALIALQSSKPIDNIPEDLKHAYKCLRVSYDNLKSDKAKGLFLLCSMFPEDHEIPNEELIRYATGIGLFGELESYQTRRYNVHCTKRKLIDSCLLLKAEDKRCVKMHDLLRDVAHEIATNEVHEIMEPKRTLKALHGDTAVKQKKIRYLYCHNMNDFAYRLDLPNLEILILVCNNGYGVSVRIPDGFFDGMKGIKVLTLKGQYKGNKLIQLMLISIEVLNNLRTLDLRSCNLGDISVLGNLQRIETLELYHCSINELPNGILELKKLRLFRLESCKIKENPYNVIGGFSEIEELYFMDNDISNGEVDSGVVDDLFNKNRISPALKRYHIEIGVDNNVLAEYLNDLITRALAIAHFNTSISNATIQNLMRRAEILCLKNLEGGCKSILPDFVEAIGGAMTELNKLELYDCLEIKCLIDTTGLSSSSGTVFSSLIRLRVFKMDNLKELCHGSTPSDFLEKLEDLTIKECHQLQSSGLFVGNLNLKRLQKLRMHSCPKLTYLFLVSIAQSLVLLEDITIELCDAMKCIIKDETQEIVHADHDQRTTLDSMFPKLTTIEVSSCEQLELFSSVALNKRQMSDSTTSSTDSDKINCPQLQNCGFFVENLNLSALQYLTVQSCPKLTYLFTLSIAQSLVLLEFLWIRSCDAMECIIKDDSKEVVDGDHDQRSTLVSIFPKLEIINIRDCGKLECFLSKKVQASMSTASSINMDKINCPQLQNCGFFVENLNLSALQWLTVDSCPKLTYLFTFSIAQSLVLLEYLTVESCDAMECIIKNDSKEAVDGDHDQRSTLVSVFPKLQWIEIRECGKLECFLSKKVQALMSAASSINMDKINCPQLQNCGFFVGNLNLSALQKLKVKSCPKLTYLFTLSIAQSLVLLEKLKIGSCDAMECIIKDDSKEVVDGDHDQRSTLVSIFSKLQKIKIRDCGKLECFLSKKVQASMSVASSINMDKINCPQQQNCGFFVGNLNLSGLQNLRVESCPKLTFLVTVSIAQSLVLLEGLIVESCDAMECIIKDDSKEPVDGDHDQRSTLVSIFPKLRSIYIGDCGKLECFLSKKVQASMSATSSINMDKINYSQLQNCGFFVGNLNLSALQSLMVRECPKLTYLFTFSIARSLVSLEDLTISDCDAMECIIKDDSKEVVDCDHDQRSTLDLTFPKLGSIEIDNCGKLECFLSKKVQTSMSAASSINMDKINYPQLQNCGFFVGNLNLSALQELAVESCPKLAYLFTFSIARSLVSLEDLTISDCDAMECIIKDDSKEVVDCDHDQRSTLDLTFPKLGSIEIDNCGKLECFLSIGPKKVQTLKFTALSINLGLEVSNLEIDINLPALEELKLVHLPNMISICTKKYHATCPSLKYFTYEDCPQFAIIEFIEHSNARQLKCNDIESEEFLEQYIQELQAEKQKFSQNASANGTEDSVHEQSISQPNSMEQQEEDSIEETVKQSVKKIPDYEEIPTSSLVNSKPRNSQSTKESFQEDLASTKVKIGTPSCSSFELGNSMPHPVLASLPKTSSEELVHEQSMNQQVSTNQQQALGETKIIKEISITDMPHDDSITDTEKQSIQEDVVSEKTKMPTSSTNYGPTILPPVSLVIPIQNALSQEPMEHEEVDFHGLFKIDSRRASLLDNAFAKYPHLWDWQKIIPPKFCKLGYESLSNMLVFLKKKTPKAMDESSKEEFEKLYAELEFCRFDKGWLASIHQRVNDRLKHLVELESQLDHVRAEIARIKDDLSKYEIVFDF